MRSPPTPSASSSKRAPRGGSHAALRRLPGQVPVRALRARAVSRASVALAVTTCVRLNLNDFVAEPSSRIVALDECHRFFSAYFLRAHDRIEFTTDAALGRGTLPLCPVDRDTHLVLQSYAALATSGAARESVLEVEGTGRWTGHFSGFDRAKLVALAAARRFPRRRPTGRNAAPPYAHPRCTPGVVGAELSRRGHDTMTDTDQQIAESEQAGAQPRQASDAPAPKAKPKRIRSRHLSAISKAGPPRPHSSSISETQASGHSPTRTARTPPVAIATSTRDSRRPRRCSPTP